MTPIAVRGFMYNKKSKKKKFEFHTKTKFNKVLVFDTETTDDIYQNLKFGSFIIYDEDVMEASGIFYNPEQVNNKELKIIECFSKEKSMKLMTVEEFVDKIFYPKVYYEQYLCVGFNLPFDISRLAIGYGYARGFMRDGFSFILSKNKNYPRITAKHNKNKLTFIKFTSGLDENRKESGFEGNFLDLSNMVFALTNESLSLEKACELFDTNPKKTKAGEHGKINPKYLEYNLTDTLATYSLYLKTLREYEKYGIDLKITKIYSPASIGKACMNKFGIKSFMELNPMFSRVMLGNIMSSYYGGRSEIKIRKQPTRVVLLDFLSMYPTVCILMDLWDFIIADKIDVIEDTENTKTLVENIRLEDIRNSETWKHLTVLVEVEPDNDIFPIRTKYDQKNVYNIGVNYVEYNGKMLFTLAEIIASKFLTGKVPKITKAYRFLPVGVQQNLKEAIICGIKIDPSKEDFFKRFIEERYKIQEEMKKYNESDFQHKVLDSKQKILKIIANATSYGIFIEVNHDFVSAKVDLYSLSKIEAQSKKPEKLGYYYNPIIATFITSASRLILATVEKLLEKEKTTHAFCDTDSMAVPFDQYEHIKNFFDQLNPYSFKVDLFKLEKENYKEKDKIKEMIDLWFYGISAKRYVLYYFDNNQIIIQKPSLHGLGHLQNPFGTDVKKWQERIWMDILKEHYGILKPEEFNDIYTSLYGLAKISISTATIMKRFEIINKGKPYSQQIKPFNFALVGIENNPSLKEKIKPIVPFTKNTQSVVYSDFINYNSCKKMKGEEYWKPLDSIMFKYKNNREAKMDGDIGTLQRKKVVVDTIVTIGKEATNIDTTGIIEKPDYDAFIDFETFREKLFQLTPKQVKPYEISRDLLWRWKKRSLKGKLKLSRQYKIILEKIMGVRICDW